MEQCPPATSVPVDKQQFLRQYTSRDDYQDVNPNDTLHVDDSLPHLPNLYFDKVLYNSYGTKQVFVNPYKGAYSSTRVQFGTVDNPVCAPFGPTVHPLSDPTPSKDYHISADRPSLLRFGSLLSDKLLYTAIDRSQSWFGRRRTREQLEEARSIQPILCYSRRLPTLRLKFCTEGKEAARCYKKCVQRDTNGQIIRDNDGNPCIEVLPCEWEAFCGGFHKVVVVVEIRAVYLMQSVTLPLYVRDIILVDTDVKDTVRFTLATECALLPTPCPKAPLEAIIPEVWAGIFSYLELCALLCVRLCCRTLRNIVDSRPECWWTSWHQTVQVDNVAEGWTFFLNMSRTSEVFSGCFQVFCALRVQCLFLEPVLPAEDLRSALQRRLEKLTKKKRVCKHMLQALNCRERKRERLCDSPAQREEFRQQIIYMGEHSAFDLTLPE